MHEISKTTLWLSCDIRLWDVHLNEVHLLVHAIGSERFVSVHPKLFLAFPLRVCPIRIMVNTHFCHIFLFVTTHYQIEIITDRLLGFFFVLFFFCILGCCFFCRVNCFKNKFLRANFANDEIDAAVCVLSTRCYP